MTTLIHSTDAGMTPPAQPESGLRIAILGYRSHPFSGGQGVYIHYLSKALAEAGHQVDVISGAPYPHLDERVNLIKMPGLNLYENGLASVKWHNFFNYADAVEWFSKLTGGFAEPYCFGVRVNLYLKRHGGQYDIIHDNQSLAYGMLSIQKRLPLVTTLHHPITSDLSIALKAAPNMWQRFLIRRWHSFLKMQKKVVKALRHVVTVSERSLEDIHEAFRIDREKLTLIYNGIDTDVFKPRPAIERSPFRLMATASADQPLKGLRFLLEAYEALLQEFPDLELVVVGKPKAGGDTEKLLKKLHLEDKVRFVTGISTDALVDLYATATLMVVPSLYEGFGLPAGEAMACEVPVISTNGGALPEVVGDAGVIIEKGSAEAITLAVKSLLSDPEKLQSLGKTGRERILNTFSWQVAAGHLTAYYRQVISSHYANR